MISCSNIVKSYGNLKVLNDISLDVKKGEIVSITGESGAGKSTLLHIMGSLDRPDSGEIHYGDTPVFSLGRRQLAEFRNKKVGFVFQFHQLLPEFTALENVSLPGWIGRMRKRDVEKRAEDILKYLGLGDRMDHKPKQLSGGEQQRVAIARALVNEPAVVLADEPSGNLDSRNAELLHQFFFKLRDDFEQTFVIVTHNPELAAMADRQIALKDGRIVK